MTDTNNGWPGKPGVPLNPKEDGPHWLSWRDEKPRAVEWDSESLASIDEDKQGFWRFGDLFSTPEQVASDGWRYHGPVALPEKVASLQGALRFYADKNSWRHTISLGHPQIDGTTSPAEEDRGKRARAALREGADET